MSVGFRQPIGASEYGSLVTLASNMDKEEYQTGRIRPTLFTVEQPQSINLLLDSADAVSGPSAFDTIMNVRAAMNRVRTARVDKVILPKINNITPVNNVIYFRHLYDGYVSIFTTVLETGLYSPSELASAIAYGMQDASTLGLFNRAPTFQCVYNALDQNFTLSHSEGFYLLDTSSFVTYGKNLARFPSITDPGSGNAAGAVTSIKSARAGMLYNRFVSIHSEALNQFAYAESRTSDPSQGVDIIGLADTTASYVPEDFDPAVEFAVNFTVLKLPNAPVLSITNPQKQLIQNIDISMRDEYGFILTEALGRQARGAASELGQSILNPIVPKSDAQLLGFTLWLLITF